ncbi:MAG: wax ester/triacylglycerol synthase family O-acyltransferase [Mycolicibacterium sp.]
MDRLTGLDGLFLHSETTVMPTHILAVAFVDPAARGDLTAGALSRLFADRASAIPAFRQRLLSKPFGLGQPAWVEDPAFEVANHVRRMRLPRPGTTRELSAVVGELHSRPLDRRRPLWEAWVIQGLADGRLAVAIKFSHAMADGVGAVTSLLPEFMTADPEAEFDSAPERSLAAASSMPGVAERIHDVVDEFAANTAKGVRLTAKLAPVAVKALLRTAVGSGIAGPEPVVDPGEATVPTAGGGQGEITLHKRLNAPLTPRRSVAFAGIPMQDLRIIADAFGVTVNDVFLTATTSALRRWSETHEAVTYSPLRTTMPISTRGADDDASNSWSMAVVSLPVHLTTVEAQLASIHAQTSRIKKGRRSASPINLGDVIDLVPPALIGLASGLYSSLKLSRFHNPVADMITSNVPGPAQQMYCAGAHVLGIHPMAPLAEGANLNVTAVSYGGTFDVGIVACPDNIEDVESIARSIEDVIGELKTTAEERTGRRAESAVAALVEPVLAPSAATQFSVDQKRVAVAKRIAGTKQPA